MAQAWDGLCEYGLHLDTIDSAGGLQDPMKPKGPLGFSAGPGEEGLWFSIKLWLTLVGRGESPP